MKINKLYTGLTLVLSLVLLAYFLWLQRHEYLLDHYALEIILGQLLIVLSAMYCANKMHD